MPFHAQSHSGILHHYHPRLVAFEHVDASAPSTSGKNYLLFLGGLNDGLCTVAYPTTLAKALANAAPSTHAAGSSAPWAVVEVLLSSSYTGWTTSNLVRDANQVGQAVAYFRNLQAAAGQSAQPLHIVLSGHSTGCQIATEYLIGPNANANVSPSAAATARPPVDGVVLQAGISDREALLMALTTDEYNKSTSAAKSWAASGRGDDILGTNELPGASATVFGAGSTATRWVSLAGPDGPGTGLDDYFSSDISPAALERTLGRITLPLCVFLGGSDPYMPPSVDKEALLEKWKTAVTHGGHQGRWSAESAVIPGATHNLNGDAQGAVDDLVSRIVRFVTTLPSAGNEQPALL